MKYAVVFVFACFMQPLIAQHFSFWMKMELKHPISSKLNLTWDLQYRRQNASEGISPFSRPLQISIRPWLDYKKGNNKIGFLPFSYIQLNRLVFQPLDEVKLPSSEVRSAIYFENTQLLIEKYSFSNKLILEARNFLNTKNDVMRLRYRLQGTSNVLLSSNYLKFSYFNEIFVNVLGVSSNSIFDNNRTGVLFGLNKKNILFEIGYQYILRNISTYVDFVQENSFMLNFRYNFQK
jgi:hypothetical protein